MKNPWNFESIEDLLFYCCPECDMKSKDSQDLMNHALQSHAKSIPIKTQKNFILDLKVIDNDPLSVVVPSIKKINLKVKKKPLVKLQKLTESKILYHTSPKKVVKEDESLIEVPIAEDNYMKGETPESQRHENFKCKLCNIQYAGTFNIKKHLAKKHKIVISRTSNKQKCNICKLKFSNIPKLIAHTDEVHKVDDGYQYGKFGIIIGSKADWYYHDLYASHVKNPKKEEEQSIFRDPHNKYFWEGKRVDGRKCELCSKSMHPASYSKHIKQCEKVVPREKDDETLIEELDQDDFSDKESEGEKVDETLIEHLDQDDCNDNFDQETSFSDEESKIENDSTDQVIDDPGMFLCLMCEEVSSSQEELSKHMESKHANETSELCESKVEVDHEDVKDNLELSEAGNVDNQVEPPILLQCNICCLDFETQQEATDHRDSKHSVEGGWKCDKCDRIFRTLEWWNNHNQNHAKVKKENDSSMPSCLDKLLKCGGISLVKPENQPNKVSLRRTNEDRNQDLENVKPLKRPKLETIKHPNELIGEPKKIIEYCPPPEPKPRKVFSKPKQKTLKKSKLKSFADYYAEIPNVEDNYIVCEGHEKIQNSRNPTLKCKLCNHKPLLGTWNMRNHLAKFHKIVISKNSKGYKCHVCDLKFKDYPDLSDHTDEVHKVDNKY